MNTINEVKAKPNEIPVLIAAGDGEPPLVTMHLSHWLHLVSNDLYNNDTIIRSVDYIETALYDLKNGGKCGKEES
jgi:hypothetical protein